jgi:hypothetical protein
MRRIRANTLICSLLAAALLLASSQYLAHFHVPRPDVAMQAQGDADAVHLAGHGLENPCSLCLQFDRLPAPPASLELPTAWFFLVATLEAERLERLALDTPHLWPPSRGPPLHTC